MRTTPTMLILCLLALFTPRAAARTPRVEAELSRTSAYVGDEVVYQVIVHGGEPVVRPEIDFPKSVRADFAGVSQQSFSSVRLVNGRRQTARDDSLIYQFRLTVNEPGVINIPPASVTLPDGRVVTTTPTRLDALLPQPAPGYFLDMELPRTTLYLGETITATVVWTIPEPVADFSFDPSRFDPSLGVTPARPDTGGGGRELVEFEFQGQRAYGLVEQVFTPSGTRNTRFRFNLQVTPTEGGEHTVGPLRVVFDRIDASRSRVRAYTESDTATLDVRPLPTAGRPPGFNGLIGTYDLRTLASPTTVNVGDPITLRAEILGLEPMVGADSPPDLATMPGFSAAFRLSPEGWREEEPRSSGRRVFTTIIRALSEETTQIPPVVLHAFDPEAGAYTPVRSAPIEIDVRSVREATIADALVTPGARARSRPTAPAFDPADPAFWASPTPEQVADARPFVFTDQALRPGAAVLLVSGPAVIAAAGVMALIRRRRAAPGHARDRALRHAAHLTYRGATAAASRQAAAAALGCDPRAVAAVDLERLPVHPGLIRTLREALATPEDHSGAGRVGPSPSDTRLAIRALRRAVRRPEPST